MKKNHEAFNEFESITFETPEDGILKEAGIAMTPEMIGLKRRIEEFNADVKRVMSKPPIFRDFDRISLLKKQREQLLVICSLKLPASLIDKLILKLDKDKKKREII